MRQELTKVFCLSGRQNPTTERQTRGSDNGARTRKQKARLENRNFGTRKEIGSKQIRKFKN